MSIEKVTITVDKYRTPDGKHTCCLTPLDCCAHYAVKRFGTIDLCTYGQEEELVRDEISMFLIPKHGCPIGD